MDKTKNKYSILIRLDICLAVLTLLSGLLFCSLIRDNGYQLYYAFLLIPLLTIAQIFKIYFIFKSNLPTASLLISLLMTPLFFIPLSDAWTHNIKITYPLSVFIYLTLTVFYIADATSLFRQNKTNQVDTNWTVDTANQAVWRIKHITASKRPRRYFLHFKISLNIRTFKFTDGGTSCSRNASGCEKTRFSFLVFQFLFLKFNLACLHAATSILFVVNTTVNHV